MNSELEKLAMSYLPSDLIEYVEALGWSTAELAGWTSRILRECVMTVDDATDRIAYASRMVGPVVIANNRNMDDVIGFIIDAACHGLDGEQIDRCMPHIRHWIKDERTIDYSTVMRDPKVALSVFIRTTGMSA